MIIPQVETELALRNLEDIVCTEGVDALFVGPMDLSMSLGVFRQFDSPRFLKAVEEIVSTCKAHNVAAGILAPTGPVQRIIEQGFKMISLGGDLAMLAENTKKTLEVARGTVITTMRQA
jgi:2-keto-3-deoxy-L-rhamnonate aldolase RhmA